MPNQYTQENAPLIHYHNETAHAREVYLSSIAGHFNGHNLSTCATVRNAQREYLQATAAARDILTKATYRKDK